jgi:hypothetical protein
LFRGDIIAAYPLSLKAILCMGYEYDVVDISALTAMGGSCIAT